MLLGLYEFLSKLTLPGPVVDRGRGEGNLAMFNFSLAQILMTL